MKAFNRSVLIAIFVSALLASGQLSSQVHAQSERNIPDSKIEDLRQEFLALEDIASTTQKRRICKNIVRSALSLIKRYPDSPNRFEVLGIVFENQKTLLILQDSERNRDEIIETCKKLMQAPDQYAQMRVEADMLLLQLELSRKESSSEDTALEIARFADRYRNTPAEAQSLMMAASSAFDIGSIVLLKAFRKALATHFSDDPVVTAFMRERFAVGSTVHLRGQFERADVKRMSFPLGQIHLVCFWSLDTPLLKDKIAEITAMQARYKGQFRVFSFNLDELADSGTAALKRMGLDWVPMRLPGGIENPTYISIGGANMFSALVVGPHGLASKGATSRNATPLHKTYEALARSPRHMSLLRSLCAGDYLVADSELPSKMTIPKDVLGAIRDCFPSPPMRYRLSLKEELHNYEKAEMLCGEAVAKDSAAPDLWTVHNFRTIALLGMWRHSGELEYLDRAVASARASLAGKLPAGAGVVSHFCIATRALVDEGADTGKVLSAFIDTTGGKNAPGSAYAAALMLSLEVHSRDDYIKYFDILLDRYINDHSTWPVSSFLLDHSCAFRLFERALPGNGEKIKKGRNTSRLFRADWTASEGKKINFSGGTNGTINAVVFMEPTGDRHATALRKRVVDHLVRAAAARPLKDLNVVGVFRSTDTNKVSAVMKQNRWSFDTVCLPEIQWQRYARELGVFAADLRPNVFLLRPDGSIMLGLSGVSSDTEGPDTLAVRIDIALRDHALALAEKALAEEDYAEYAARLATSFPLKNRKRSRHEPESLAPSVHRRKLVWAYMQAQDWKRALEAANDQIAALSGKHNPKEDPKIKWCRVCHGYLHSMLVRIVLLRETGAKKQADEVLALIDFPKCPKGKGVDALWAEVESYIKERRKRWSHWNDPKQHLTEHEKNMRSGRQNLYGFRIENDLMMRAKIHEKLGNPAAAKADRRNANVRAWPFKVREYDPDLLHEASVRRRKPARKHLEAGQWKQALELVNRNIEIHEGEALRCNSMCKICSAQVQSFGFRARTQEGLGRKKEAEASRAMAKDAQCPTGKERESYKCFPVNRMYGGGTGINRLNFIDQVMTGENPYANKQHRIYRLEFSSDLMMRSQALEQLGETAKAAVDRKRATALAYPHGPNALWNIDADELPSRYVDLLSMGNDEE